MDRRRHARSATCVQSPELPALSPARSRCAWGDVSAVLGMCPDAGHVARLSSQQASKLVQRQALTGVLCEHWGPVACTRSTAQRGLQAPGPRACLQEVSGTAGSFPRSHSCRACRGPRAVHWHLLTTPSGSRVHAAPEGKASPWLGSGGAHSGKFSLRTQATLGDPNQCRGRSHALGQVLL